MSDRIRIFEKELGFIEDPTHREFISNIIEQLPDYFFTVPASSTGKYHPQVSLGEGGLVRHTKFATRIATDLLQLEFCKSVTSPFVRDVVIGSLLIHDGLKHGSNENKYTLAEHPVLIAELVRQQQVESGELEEYKQAVALCVSSHMGEWNTDFRTQKEILPKPENNIQFFCTYL